MIFQVAEESFHSIIATVKDYNAWANVGGGVQAAVIQVVTSIRRYQCELLGLVFINCYQNSICLRIA